MKRYRFRLAQVLRVRQVQEELARSEMAAAHRGLAAAESALAERVDHYESVAADDEVGSFLYQRARGEWAALGVALGTAQRATAADAVVESQAAWADAARRVRALERLDDRRRDEHGMEAARAEQQVLDEVASRCREVVE